MDILEAHKAKAKTYIARIGPMISVVDCSSLCINMDSIITTITTAENSSPILHQFAMNFIKIGNNTEWGCWFEYNHGRMPNLHWHCYTFLEKIFNHIADFATNFGNVNIVTESCPILDLNIQPSLT